MSDQLTTPRAALLAFAAWLDRTDMPAPMPSSVTAQLAREYAENYADEAPGFAVEAAIAAALVPDPYRVEALQAAAHWHIGSGLGDYDPADVIRAARPFEAYLRGDQ